MVGEIKPTGLNLEKICAYFEISRSQREDELAAGLGVERTEEFEKTGCYDCDGYNFECPTYFNLNN